MLADAGWLPGFGLLWIVLVWGVVAFFFWRRRGWRGGEITEDEYRERLGVLKGGR